MRPSRREVANLRAAERLLTKSIVPRLLRVEGLLREALYVDEASKSQLIRFNAIFISHSIQSRLDQSGRAA